VRFLSSKRRREGRASRLLDLKRSAARENVERRLRAAILRSCRLVPAVPLWLWAGRVRRVFLDPGCTGEYGKLLQNVWGSL